MLDIVGIDTPNIDLILNFDDFPKPNQFSLVQNTSWQGGGKVATGLVAAARLGAKTAILGAVGDDVYGRFIQKDFVWNGVDTACLCTRTQSTTNSAVILSDKESGGRSIAWMPGTAAPITPEEIPDSYFNDTRFFFIAGTGETALACARQARQNGAKVMVDLDHEIDHLEDCLATTDIVIASEFVYEQVASGATPQEACRTIVSKGPQIVIFTFGAKGCVGFGPDGDFEVPAFLIETVDTVGAGDVFHGAFLAGLLQNKNAEQAARFASAVSAIKCTCIGGRSGIPNTATALQFIETGRIDTTELSARVAYYSRGLNHV